MSQKSCHKISPIQCRFYLVKHVDKNTPLKDADVDELVIDRPTKWSIFCKSSICYIFKICSPLYGFVRLPIKQASQLFTGEKFGVLHPNRMRINGNVYWIEHWTFLNLCMFCLEGIRL